MQFIVKMKKKPKPNFNIASVLKDLRQENIQLEAEDQEDEIAQSKGKIIVMQDEYTIRCIDDD